MPRIAAAHTSPHLLAAQAPGTDALDSAAGDAARGAIDSPALRSVRERVEALSNPRSVLADPRLVTIGLVGFWLGLNIIGFWVLALYAAAAVAFEVLRHRRVRAYRAYHTARCRSCGYSLAGLADAIPPALVGGHAVGPTQCPECGTRWPRVPPA